MMFNLFLTVVVCLQLWPLSPVTSYSSLENNNGGCGTSDTDRTWTSYLDEKCIKIFDKLVSFEEAESICQKDYYYYDDSQYQYEARLVTINSAEEQAFLQDFLFEKNDLSDSVWLGAMWNPNVTGNATDQFEWHRAGGQTDLWGPYTNWRKGYPRGLPKKNVTLQAEVTGVLGNANDNNKTCVEMSAGVDEATGQWINEPCSKNNRVVCERRQKWKDTKIQELLEKVTRQQNVLLQQNAELKKKVEEYIEQKNKSDAEDEVQLKASKIAVPVGFVYVQLPGELAPEVVFPSSEDNPKSSALWKDISPNFEGVFFRVAGSQSGPFGAVQEQSAPAIDAIKRNWCFVGADGACNHHDAYNGQSADAKDQITLSSSRGTGTGNGTWSEPIWTVNKYVANGTGEEGPFYGEYLHFHTTNVEVRPRNMAVKVWKRVKYVQILPSGCFEKGDGLGNRNNCSASVSRFLTLSVDGSDDKFCSNDGWSAPLWTAFNYASLSEAYDDVKAYADYHQYHLSSSSATEAGTAEVRPRNMAVKVWKRTG